MSNTHKRKDVMNVYAFHLSAMLILVIMGAVCLSACAFRPGMLVRYGRIRGKYSGADERLIYALVAIFFIIGGIIFFLSR